MKINIYSKHLQKAVSENLPDTLSDSEVILSPICSFSHVFQNMRKGENGIDRPSSELVYSRSDYDGYRWHTSWSVSYTHLSGNGEQIQLSRTGHSAG